jgi:hypothetical protein
MDNLNSNERHFRVVKYFSDFGIGVSEEVLASHLTREEAERVARENPPLVSDEDVAIEDENSTDFE